MGSYYNKNFAINSPIFFVLMLGALFLGVVFRQSVDFPTILPASHILSLSKFGLSSSFITSATTFFCWVELILSLLTILALFFLGQNMVGKTAGICAAFTFAVYPFFVQNTYSLNIFLLFSFILYLLFMYIGIQSMSKLWNFISGVFFIIACIMEPALLLLGLLPYIYFLIKQKHIATLNSFLFFLLGIILMLGFFTLVAIAKGNLYNLVPLSDSFSALISGIKAFFSNPINYITQTIWSNLRDTFAYPKVAGDYSYLHYFIVTLTILGVLYSFINENIRILAILLVFMLLQFFFMPFEYIIIFTVFILIASFMVDKVVKDVLKL